MPRTFKRWTPATAELELLHECWRVRLPPARIAARLCISEPKLNRFMRRGRCPGRNLPGRAIKRHQATRTGCSRASSAYERGGRRALIQLGAAVSAAPSRSRLSQIDPKFARSVLGDCSWLTPRGLMTAAGTLRQMIQYGTGHRSIKRHRGIKRTPGMRRR